VAGAAHDTKEKQPEAGVLQVVVRRIEIAYLASPNLTRSSSDQPISAIIPLSVPIANVSLKE
jgi:hypothetical protein